MKTGIRSGKRKLYICGIMTFLVFLSVFAFGHCIRDYILESPGVSEPLWNSVRPYFIVEGMILLAFCAFMLIVFVDFYKSTELAKRDVESYNHAATLSRTILFEYDIRGEKLRLSGGNGFFLDIDSYSWEEMSLMELRKRIHESDLNVFNRVWEFIDVGGSEEWKCSVDFRLLAGDGNFYWHRLTGSVVMGADGKPAFFAGNVENVNDQITHERRLKKMAHTDLLSTLLNKGYMKEKVCTALASCNDSFVGAFYIIDLDNFKFVNDKLGHSMGDITISDVASKLKLVFSEKDYIGRIGGDEFCVFLRLPTKLSQEQALAVVKEKASTLCEILQEDYFNGEDSVRVSASIGVSLFPSQATDYEGLFNRADRALYSVKQEGKNNYRVFSEDLGEKGESVYE